jgi:hypothetical protein
MIVRPYLKNIKLKDARHSFSLPAAELIAFSVHSEQASKSQRIMHEAVCSPEDSGECIAIHSRIQRAKLLAQHMWQHWNSELLHVNGG